MSALRIFSRFAELLDVQVTRAAAVWLRLNADGSVSQRTASETLIDLGLPEVLDQKADIAAADGPGSYVLRGSNGEVRASGSGIGNTTAIFPLKSTMLQFSTTVGGSVTLAARHDTATAARVITLPDATGNLGLVASTTGQIAISDVSNLQTALDAKAPLASPTFTGTVSGITKSMVGLGNVDNTSDANKPVSTAQQTALDTKASKREYKTASFTAVAYGRYVVSSGGTVVITNPTTGVVGDPFEVVIAAGSATINGVTYSVSRFPIEVVCSVAGTPGTWTTPAANVTGTLTATTFSGSGASLTGVSLTSGVTGTLPIANGGTGGATQSAAWTGLGGGGTIASPTFTSIPSPGPIGATTPSTGSFSTLAASGNVNLSAGSILTVPAPSAIVYANFVNFGGGALAVRDDKQVNFATELTNSTSWAQNGSNMRFRSDHVLNFYGTSNVFASSVEVTISRASAGVLRIGTSTGNALGSLQLTNLTASGTVKLGAYTVATLPSASTSGAFTQAGVTDSLLPAIGSTVAAGGSARCIVTSNGTAWIVTATL